MSASSASPERPAWLGGPAVRPAGPPEWPLRDPRIEATLADLGVTGEWGRYHGPWGPRLTERIAGQLQVRHVQLCSSGTVGVELALRGLGVQPGDEVILAAYDFKTNFTNVLHLGAKPVLVDVRTTDGQLAVDQLDEARSERTRCVIASHLHGGLVDMTALRAWSARHKVPILEDACQATGGLIAGVPVGAWGDVGVFSFGGSKLVSAGRGGCLVTQRDDVAQRIKLASQRGNDVYPLSELQAAVLIPQWEQLSTRHLRRRESVEWLSGALERWDLRPIGSPLGQSAVRPVSPANSPAFYKLGLWYDANRFSGLSRDHFAAAMRAEGVAIDAGFPPLHLTHARGRFRAVGDLHAATACAERMLTLHHPVLLGTQSDLLEIVAAVEKVAHWADELRAAAESGRVGS